MWRREKYNILNFMFSDERLLLSLQEHLTNSVLGRRQTLMGLVCFGRQMTMVPPFLPLVAQPQPKIKMIQKQVSLI